MFDARNLIEHRELRGCGYRVLSRRNILSGRNEVLRAEREEWGSVSEMQESDHFKARLMPLAWSLEEQEEQGSKPDW